MDSVSNNGNGIDCVWNGLVIDAVCNYVDCVRNGGLVTDYLDGVSKGVF